MTGLGLPIQSSLSVLYLVGTAGKKWNVHTHFGAHSSVFQRRSSKHNLINASLWACCTTTTSSSTPLGTCFSLRILLSVHAYNSFLMLTLVQRWIEL